MPRRLIKQYMPDHDKIRTHKHLQCLGTLLHHKYLWHLNRHSVAIAFAIGLFFAFVPVPFQMLLAAIGAILLHGNLPISVALVWLTNPLTMPPIFYAAYLLGARILDTPAIDAEQFSTFSWDWLLNGLSAIWQPFLLGCFVMGVTCAIVGYASIHIAWRLLVLRRWRHRHSSQHIA